MTQSLSLLPFMPLDPAWIEQAESFRHPDPRMLKASLKLLFAAWRGAPAASIPSSHSYIAEATGLPQDLVAERYITLTDGFELGEDGRLHHLAMTAICTKMMEGYGPEIESYTVALAMVAQDPEQFSLMSVEAGKTGSKLRGKTLLPKGFGFDSHPELRPWCGDNGYPAPNQQTFVMAAFVDWTTSRGDKYKDWASTFRTWARNEISYRKYPPPPEWPVGHPGVTGQMVQRMPGGPGAAFAGLSRSRTAPATRGEQALDHNRSLMGAGRPMAPRG